MGTLKVGAGKAVINPSEDLFPLGKFEAVKDDVHVRALVVENGGVRFLLLEYEPGHPPAPEFKKEISERYSIPEELIITTSIHNHSSCDWGINEKKIPGMSAPIKMPPDFTQYPRRPQGSGGGFGECVCTKSPPAENCCSNLNECGL